MQKIKEGLSEGSFGKKISLMKEPYIKELFTTPISILNTRYKDLFGEYFSVNGKKPC